MAGVLDGIKIVDMGHVAAIPAAGTMLADWGADVIKVEPLSGDRLRESIKGPNPVGAKWRFYLHNKNKRGIALDLKQEPGREILYKLVQKSDVFMSNYLASALKTLKADYTSLKRINPKLIYGILTGFGTEGPDKDERAFDWTAGWARSGIQYSLSKPGETPVPQRPGFIDRTAALAMVAGLMAALVHKERTGKGQKIEISLYQTGVWVIASDIQQALIGEPIVFTERTKGSPLTNDYLTRDNRWFRIMVRQDEWPQLCKAVQMPELAKDPRFEKIEKSTQHAEQLIQILDATFASKDIQEWEKRFKENGVIFAKAQTPLEVANDVQALDNNFFTEIKEPSVGNVKLVNTPVKFCQNPSQLRMLSPELGQHTEEILLDLGYNQDDITRFRNGKVIL